MGIADTRVTQFPQKPGISPWRELWTVNACGKLVEVPVRFVPSYPRPGVTYEVSMPKGKTSPSGNQSALKPVVKKPY